MNLGPTGQLTRFTPDDADAGGSESFGFSVAMDGDWAVVGCPNKVVGMINPGAAYVYHRVSGTWTYVQRLVSSDGAALDGFGRAVAISGSYIVVGAPNRLAAVGGAYVFRLTGTVWAEEQILAPSVSAADDAFGTSVAISGVDLVVGSPGADEGAAGAGLAFTFHRAAGVWSETTKLISPARAAGGAFGTRVAMDGGTLVVGEPGSAAAGALQVYERQLDDTWLTVASLARLALHSANGLGTYGIAISGELIAAGMPLEHNTLDDTGAVYIFRLVGSVWGPNEDQRIAAPPRFEDVANEYFGYSVSLDGTTLAVGATADRDLGVDPPVGTYGSVFLFADVADVGFQLCGRAHPAVVGGTGFDVAVSESTRCALTGAPNELAGAVPSEGAIRFYQLAPTDGIEMPLAGLYLDALYYVNGADDVILTNCVPKHGETQVKQAAVLRFQVLALNGAAIDATTRVWVDYGAGDELAYSQAAGGFQAGFSGTMTLVAPPGSVVQSEQWFELWRVGALWPSLEQVTLRVDASAGGSHLLGDPE